MKVISISNQKFGKDAMVASAAGCCCCCCNCNCSSDDTTTIVACLMKNGHVVSEIKKNKIGLEEYYIELISAKEGQ